MPASGTLIHRFHHDGPPHTHHCITTNAPPPSELFLHFCVNKYYDLVTSFYEYGWGESFHFAPRWKGESLKESIKRHEHFLALQLGLKPGQTVLDVGCGIADFMKMPFPENSFDTLYAIEATCHASDALRLHNQIPLSTFLNKFPPPVLFRLITDIRSTRQCLAALKETGFEVIWEQDLAKDSPLPWYLPLDTSHYSLSSFDCFRLTATGLFITKNVVIALEYVGLAPKGSQIQSFLEKAAEGIVVGGKWELIFI
ncbi:hypothetical protein L2E82_43994 [Cichorium intybus]|uniref:Uncharacterized protein n=1 Tax=Cichorium intybus TaxID=13427 RepID=A0ACB8ZNM5_CICIN|nr:hypothetical protein L2E82_43994 [Cichorium intybus]